MDDVLRLEFQLHPKQLEAFESPANEQLYGGGAGGGKSHLSRVRLISACLACPGLQAYFFRRLFDDIIKNHMEGPNGLRALLAPLVEIGVCQIVETEVRFKNGSRLFLCHCQHSSDVYKYQGPEFHILCIEEAGQFEEGMVRFLRSRVRVPVEILSTFPEWWQKRLPAVYYTANPGGVGHHFLREWFIDPRPPLALEQVSEEEGGYLRQFVPALLGDNPSIDYARYVAALKGLGSPELVRAYLEGDWSVVTGAYFPEMREKVHGVTPFAVPKHWPKFRSLDWGSARPFAVYWWTVSDGVTEVGEERRIYPRNAMIAYREWYGASTSNVGLKMHVGEVAAGIKFREMGETIDYGVIDPACGKEDGGPSILETFRTNEVYFRTADNTRLSGWQQLRDRLLGEDDKPMIYFFNTCRHAFRTIPALQHDERKPEDLDTDGEDHAADSVRYAVMSRPYTRPKPHVYTGPKPNKLTWDTTFGHHLSKAKTGKSWR